MVSNWRRLPIALPLALCWACQAEAPVTPVGLRIFDIGEDYVLGVWEGDLDVEHVGLYELKKP